MTSPTSAGDAEGMVVELQLTQADWAALQRLAVERIRERAGRTRLLAAALLPVAAGTLVAGLLSRSPGAVLAFAAGILTVACSIGWANHLVRPGSLPDKDGTLLGAVRMEFSAEGFRTSRPSSVTVTHWSALQEVTRTDTHVFLWVDRLSAHIIPLRELADGQGERLLQAIQWFGGPAPVGRANANAPAIHEPTKAASSREFLTALARRLTWRALPRDAADIASGDAMILTCAAATLCVWLARDRYVAGPGAWFFPGGLPSIVWFVAGVLGLAWVLHVASLRSAAFRPLLASIMGSLPLLLVAGVAIRQWLPEPVRLPVYALVGLAALSRLGLYLKQMSSRVRPALLAGVLFSALFVALTKAAWVHPSLWFAADPDRPRRPLVGFEEQIFAQSARIDGAAERMTPPRPGQPDLFFVGFAGDAEQKVFAEELRLAEQVVTRRYGAVGRSLLLLNDRRDRETAPMATVAGLRHALARVGARMDPAQDVLFLMLTSHGSDEPSLSVTSGDWPLRPLDGRALRAALDEAGIRWRVIVISACHSGAFIAPLADEGTIVLTASAKDRTSFGCGAESELTYFGQALFRDALPGAGSLSEAFEHAKRLVDEREKREQRRASQPQSYYGSTGSTHWARLEEARPEGDPPGTR